MTELTYYFSTGSRYSFLSMSQLPQIERRCGVQFRWVPVNGKRIRALRGADPFKGEPQSGQYDWGYRERDAKAWAKYYGIEFNEPHDVEFDVELLLRGVIAASKQTDIRDFAWQLARCVFELDCWPLDQSVVDDVARRCGLDMTAFAASCQDPIIQQELERNCEEAVARGAFGTPSLFVGEQLFWGNDRLVLLRDELERRSAQRPYRVRGLDHVVLRAADPESLVAFYQSLFGAALEREVGDFLWQLRIGDSLLDIIRGERAEQAPNVDHFCLRVSPFNERAILDQLSEAGVPAEAVGDIYGAQGFGPSIYFTDPVGNRVELKAVKGG